MTLVCESSIRICTKREQQQCILGKVCAQASTNSDDTERKTKKRKITKKKVSRTIKMHTLSSITSAYIWHIIWIDNIERKEPNGKQMKTKTEYIFLLMIIVERTSRPRNNIRGMPTNKKLLFVIGRVDTEWTVYARARAHTVQRKRNDTTTTKIKCKILFHLCFVFCCSLFSLALCVLFR